jgi:hypothetical protein
MKKRRRFRQTISLQARLSAEAERLKRKAARDGMTGRIVSSVVSIGLEDRQLDVCWLELLPKIIIDIAERNDLSSCGTATMRGLERHITKPVVLS